MKTARQDKIGIALFLIPGMVLFCLFFILPVIYVIVTSFTTWDGITAPVFAGFENYKTIFSDKTFRRSIQNNIIWALAAGFVQVPLAMLMAIILARKPRGWKFFRTVYFFPQVVSGIALAMLWQAVYNSEFGLLNGFLKVIGLEQYCTNWLGNPKTAFAAVVVYWVFYIGYYMVIMMSEITGIDEAYYEAAEIDGATKIQQDLKITIPLMKNSLLTCVTLATVLGLRTFEQVYIMTNGGPANRTSVLVMYLYKQMQSNNYGRANAAAMTLIVVGTCVILLIRKLFNLRKDQQ
ncbi:MAG: sugar ABC transporter permease [Angelakisella sp.]|nr:sugar ABC transporter permease [Angelakisella sp.]